MRYSASILRKVREMPEQDKQNDIKAITAFFERDSEPLAKGEMIAFWKNLTDEEKAYFKQADLS